MQLELASRIGVRASDNADEFAASSTSSAGPGSRTARSRSTSRGGNEAARCSCSPRAVAARRPSRARRCRRRPPHPQRRSTSRGMQLAGPVKDVAVTASDATLVPKVKDLLAGAIGKDLDRTRLREATTKAFALPGVADVLVRGTQRSDGITLDARDHRAADGARDHRIAGRHAAGRGRRREWPAARSGRARHDHARAARAVPRERLRRRDRALDHAARRQPGRRRDRRRAGHGDRDREGRASRATPTRRPPTSRRRSRATSRRARRGASRTSSTRSSC